MHRIQTVGEETSFSQSTMVLALAERVTAFGTSSLSDAELVSLVLGTPGTVSRDLLDSIGTVSSLPTRRIGELSLVSGVSRTRALRLLAATELGRRAIHRPDAGAPLTTPGDVRARCAHLASEPVEVFVAIAVNSRNRVVGEWVIARGWESGVNLTPRQVFTLLVKEGAHRVVFLHNHPSGDPTPSPEDVRFTQRLIEAARTLDIKVLDHVIVASGGFASMREQAREDVAFG